MVTFIKKSEPKRSMGQNFLTSTAARAHIVGAGNISVGDQVLEIGPGRGFLTEGLLTAGAIVTALEMDSDLIPVLQDKFKDWANKLNLIQADALLYDTASIKTNYKLIANIPYYITGAIIRKYLEATHKPSSMVILIQREVAERIIARDGVESILSIAVKIYGRPRIVSRVLAGSFYPRPKVDSAILAIEHISNQYFDSFSDNATDNVRAESLFFTFIRSAFAHKRKYMINNICQAKEFSSIHKEKLKELMTVVNLDERVRAENVTIEQWKLLFSSLYTLL